MCSKNQVQLCRSSYSDSWAWLTMCVYGVEILIRKGKYRNNLYMDLTWWKKNDCLYMGKSYQNHLLRRKLYGNSGHDWRLEWLSWTKLIFVEMCLSFLHIWFLQTLDYGFSESCSSSSEFRRRNVMSSIVDGVIIWCYSNIMCVYFNINNLSYHHINVKNW